MNCLDLYYALETFLMWVICVGMETEALSSDVIFLIY